MRLIRIPGIAGNAAVAGGWQAICLIGAAFAAGADLRLAALQIGAQLFSAALGAFRGLALDFGLTLRRLGVWGWFLGHDGNSIAQNRTEVKDRQTDPDSVIWTENH